MFFYKACGIFTITAILGWSSFPLGLDMFLILIAIISGACGFFFSGSSRKKSFLKSKKDLYKCPNCGALNDHPGTCSGQCSGDGHGVFKA